MTQCVDSDLVRLAQQGDATAFGNLVSEYRLPVYHLALRLLHSEAEAEDATQETFLRAFARFDSFQPDRPLRSWLMSIAAHICIDQLRHEAALPVGNLGAFEPVSDSQDPEITALAHERDAELRQLLQSLSPEGQRLLILRYWDDLSYAEMSQAAGLSESAVKSRLHRARQQLGRLARRLLAPGTETPPARAQA